MKYILLTGRILFSTLFIFTSFGSIFGQTTSYAVAAGVPGAAILVPLAGIAELIGGLSILLGFQTKLGAWLIVIFLIPVTFVFHAFWNISDPMQKQMQMADFMKNISLLGAALSFTWFGSGPLSLDSLFNRRLTPKNSTFIDR